MLIPPPEYERPGEKDASQPGAHVTLRVITRRRFLSYLSGVLSALIAAALAIPLIRFYVGNAFKPRAEHWLKLGPATALKPSEPQLYTVSYIVQDGWRQTNFRQEVYVVTQNERDYFVLSNICTHLGCPVHWDDSKREFLCPCHGGIFSIEGNVLHGPPPRPLARVPLRVEGGVMYVKVAES